MTSTSIEMKLNGKDSIKELASKSEQLNELRDTWRVASRVYGGGSMLLHCGRNADLKLFTTEIFQNIATKSEKSTCLQLLSSKIRSNQVAGIEGRIYSIIDSIPSMLEAVTNEFDGVGVVDFVEAVLDSENQEFNNRFSSSLTKIINACVHLINKPSLETNFIGFATIRALASTNRNATRHSLLMHSSQLISACCCRLEHPALVKEASTTCASVYAIESAEHWSAAFQKHCEALDASLRPLEGIVQLPSNTASAAATGEIGKQSGIFSNVPSSGTGKRDKKAAASSTAMHSNKALSIERAVRGHCSILEKMLQIGCTGGFAKLNFGLIFRISSVILPLNIDASLENTKSMIENEFGIAPADLCVVSSQLKISLLIVLEAILCTQDTMLIRCGNQIVSMLGAIISSMESTLVPELGRIAWRCVGLAAKCFPSATAQSASNSSGCAFTIVQNAVLAVKHITSLSGTVESEWRAAYHEAEIENNTAELLHACENLLLFCGPLLSQKVRVILESIVADCLVALLRGIHTSQICGDRRLKRSNSELLRTSPRLQIAVLQLAAVELVSPHTGGYLSGNVSLLKSVAQAALSCPALSAEAARTLLVVSAVLHPTIVLQAQPPIISAERKAWTNGASLAEKIRSLDASINVEDNEIDLQQVQAQESDAVDRRKRQLTGDDNSTELIESTKKYQSVESAEPIDQSTAADFSPAKNESRKVSSVAAAASMASLGGMFSLASRPAPTASNTKTADDDNDFPEII